MLPQARVFDNLAVRKAVRRKLRGTWPAWRRRLASGAPATAGDLIKSRPRRFQHFPDSSRGSVNDNGNWQPGTLCGPPGIAWDWPNGNSP
eukprot:242157-Chlamydomonas_euryale.AAC.1